MTEDEKKLLTKDLSTSLDFLYALDVCKSQLPSNGEINLYHVALYFFSQGCISCIEYHENEKMTRAFKYKA